MDYGLGVPQLYGNGNNTNEKTISNSENDKKKSLAWAEKYRSWTVNDWKKMFLNDETHLFEQGYKSNINR